MPRKPFLHSFTWHHFLDISFLALLPWNHLLSIVFLAYHFWYSFLIQFSLASLSWYHFLGITFLAFLSWHHFLDITSLALLSWHCSLDIHFIWIALSMHHFLGITFMEFISAKITFLAPLFGITLLASLSWNCFLHASVGTRDSSSFRRSEVNPLGEWGRGSTTIVTQSYKNGKQIANQRHQQYDHHYVFYVHVFVYVLRKQLLDIWRMREGKGKLCFPALA